MLAGNSHAGRARIGNHHIIPHPVVEMGLDAALERGHEIVVEHEQRCAQRHACRTQHGQRNGAHQQDGSQDREDTLRVHMNSFSFFSPSYKEDTKLP